jgi:hypothetical protein
VSPYRRCLKTLIRITGKKHWKTIPTIIQPLCAETTAQTDQQKNDQTMDRKAKIKSIINQGDLGHTKEENETRFPKEKLGFEQYTSFDFSTLDSYCQSRGLKDGAWWTHTQSAETPTEFQSRVTEFKQWLASEIQKKDVTHVLLISHSTFLTAAFDAAPYDNCEFRSFNFFYKTGTISRCYEATIPTILVIDSVTETDKILATVEISGQVNGEDFSQKTSLSDIRSTLHQMVRKNLSDKIYKSNFATTFPSTQIMYFSSLENWLNELCVAVEKGIFKEEIKEKIFLFFTEEKAEKIPGGIVGNIYGKLKS